MVTGEPAIAGYGDFVPLGRGGFATVYRARQLAFDREVAVKVVDRPAAGERAVQQFTSECQTIGSLSWHPHVVTVYDAGETQDGHLYIAMELVPGGSVAERMVRAPLPVDLAIRYGTHVADAVTAAHDVGVLHRDLKPANVLIDRRDAAQLADFGIARMMSAEATTTGMVSGTISYLAPELLQGGAASAASDVYGIGLTIAAMVMGRSPFAADTDETPYAAFARVTTEPLPDLRPYGLTAELADLLARCAAKAPERRPASAAVVRDELEAGGRALELGAVATPPAEPTVLVREPPPRDASPPVPDPPPAAVAVPVPVSPPDQPATPTPTADAAPPHVGSGGPTVTGRSRRPLVLAVAVILAVVAAVLGTVVGLVLSGRTGSDSDCAASPPRSLQVPEQEGPTTTAEQPGTRGPTGPGGVTTTDSPDTSSTSTSTTTTFVTGSTTPSGEPC